MGQLKYVLFFLAVLGAAGCVSKPPAAVEAPPEVVEAVEPPAVFEPAAVSKEVFDSTKNDVQGFIDELNGLIRRKNFDGWKAHLSDSYFAHISSDAYLQELSSRPAMKVRNLKLRSAADYFNHVVVPAREFARVDERVDDIEFVNETTVKAYTFNDKNERLRLYELERSGDTWKIIN